MVAADHARLALGEKNVFVVNQDHAIQARQDVKIIRQADLVRWQAASSLMQLAVEDAQKIREQAHRDAEEIRGRGYDEGLSEGLAEGLRLLNEAARSHLEQFYRLEDRLAEVVSNAVETLFGGLGEREKICAIVRGGLRQMGEQHGAITILAHPSQTCHVAPLAEEWAKQFPDLQCRVSGAADMALDTYEIRGSGWQIQGGLSIALDALRELLEQHHDEF